MGTEDASHVAVLLAAGGSTRLGQPKQLLTRQGETLVHRAARLMLDTRPRELVVVLGAHRDAVGAALHGLAHRALHNAAWQEGLASSLRLAAAHVAAPRVLVALCDQPALEREHLLALLDAGGCAATRHDERAGAPAVLDAATWSHAARLTGDRGFGPWLARIDALTVLDIPALRHDLDTPDDLAVAAAQGWIDARAI